MVLETERDDVETEGYERVLRDGEVKDMADTTDNAT
jgi:hypothetical protein